MITPAEKYAVELKDRLLLEPQLASDRQYIAETRERRRAELMSRHRGKIVLDAEVVTAYRRQAIFHSLWPKGLDQELTDLINPKAVEENMAILLPLQSRRTRQNRPVGEIERELNEASLTSTGYDAELDAYITTEGDLVSMFTRDYDRRAAGVYGAFLQEEQQWQ